MYELIEAHLILHTLATITLVAAAAWTAMPLQRRRARRLPELQPAKLIQLAASPKLDTTIHAKAA